MSRATFAAYDPQDVISRKELASILGVSVKCLELWAKKGGGAGPPYIRLGSGPAARVRYKIKSVQEWLAERERASTTSSEAP
jgi:predicted DNA-binding transcriptional regulator AlpA